MLTIQSLDDLLGARIVARRVHRHVGEERQIVDVRKGRIDVAVDEAPPRCVGDPEAEGVGELRPSPCAWPVSVTITLKTKGSAEWSEGGKSTSEGVMYGMASSRGRRA